MKQTLVQRFGRRRLSESKELYLLMLPVLVMVFIFFYLPMFGIVIAFQDYTPGDAFFSFQGDTAWVGLKHFKSFLSSIYFPRLLKNTLTLSVLNLAVTFWIPIGFALLVNEIRHLRYKKVVQTASYMPYFISMVVAAGMVISFIEKDGLINQIIMLFGGDAISFRTDPKWFPVVYTVTNVWKCFGWNSILYLSAMSSIDTALYESARIDGANRWQQMYKITLPMIAPTIAIMLIFAVGDIMTSNTDLILLLYNNATVSLYTMESQFFSRPEHKNEYQKATAYYGNVYPDAKYCYTAIATDEQNTRKSEIATDLSTYFSELVTDFVLGRASFDKWDEYMSQLKTLGLDGLLHKELCTRAISEGMEVSYDGMTVEI